MKLLPCDSSSDLDKAQKAAGRLNRLGPVGGVRAVEAGRVNPATYVKLGHSVQPTGAAPSLLDAPGAAPTPPAPAPRLASLPTPHAPPAAPARAMAAPTSTPAPAAPPPSPLPVPPAAPPAVPEPPPQTAAPLRSAKPAAFAPLETPSFEPEPPPELSGRMPSQFEAPRDVQEAPSFEPELSEETSPFEASSVLEDLEPSPAERPTSEAHYTPKPSAFQPEAFERPASQRVPFEPIASHAREEEAIDLPPGEEVMELQAEEETGPEVPEPVFELEPQSALSPRPPLPPAPQVARPLVVAPPPILTPEPEPAFSEEVTEISFETSFEDGQLSPEEELPPPDASLPLAEVMPPPGLPGEMVFDVEDLGAEDVADAAVIDVTEIAEVLPEEPAAPASWDPFLEDGLFLTRSRSALLIDADGRVVASKGDLSANAVDTVAGRLFPAIQQTPPSAPFISLRLGRFFATAVRLTNRNLVVGFVSENPIREELVPLIQKEFNEAR